MLSLILEMVWLISGTYKRNADYIVLDIMSVLTVVKQAHTIAALGKICKTVCHGLKSGLVPAGIPMVGAAYISVLKKAEDSDDLIIRFHEYTGSRQKVLLTPGFDCSEWAEGDLRERPLEAYKAEPIQLELHPYEIKTILIHL